MKILLVCESSHLYESGGRVVRYITKVLKKQENQLKLVVLSDKRDDYNLDEFYVDNNVDFLPLNKRLYARIFRVFFDTKEVRRFKITFK